ncbi:MAG: ABC transporter substrate-binding protein [Proteobacteria bacterium]|nr:ABC transporter substrate-binding protein [Pseudomonadota bacterium]
MRVNYFYEFEGPTMISIGTCRFVLAVALGLLYVGPAQAADATIALRSETSSIDPHFALVGANQTVAQHIFESLLDSDANMRPAPGLAESWRLVEPDLWEFRLRGDAVFHDGSPVTAEDVKFSIERMPNVPNSPAPFVRLAGAVVRIEVVDPHTVRLRTRGFDPSVPLNATTAYIVSSRHAAGASTRDFNEGKAAVGSGPYRFVEWIPGQHLVLKRFERYHGAKPAFETVTLRPISSDASRVAALLAGDVQLVDSVPPSEIAKLQGSASFAVWSAASSRIMYLGLEQGEAKVAGIAGADGTPLDRNPLLDVRVRRAISHAINRTAIVERLLLGAGQPAGQMVPEGMTGYDPGIAVPVFDPELSRRLLAEAGYPKGFRIALSTPNNRYVEDSRTAQSIAQMLSRVGITVSVDVMPANIFFTRAARREFPFYLIGFGSTVGDAYPAMSQVLHSYDRDRGVGGLNRMRYSDPVFDDLLARSQAQVDAGAREELLRRAARLAMIDDVAIVPLHFLRNVWATRAGLKYQARADENTLAALLAPAGAAR